MAVTRGFVKQENSASVRSDLRARLDAYANGEHDYETLLAGLKEICKVNADAVWELLSLLDQYRRRAILTDEDFRQLKNAANYIAFGPPPDAGKSAPSAEKPGHKTQANAAAGSAPLAAAPRSSAANEWRLAEDLTEEELGEAALSPTDAMPRAFDGRHTSVTATQSTRPARAAHAPSDAPLQPGRVLHDRYTIESALAFGHRSAVFRALDRFCISDAERPVAIKTLLVADSPQAPAEFERELRIGQQLAHPNIVKVFDLDRDGDLLFYSMELIEGATLGELLRHAPPQRQQASSIVNQVADALSYMHERGFVHGDLHPGNILISNAGQVKLVDFGAAAGPASSAHAPATAVTGTNSSSGLSYASCERLAGAAAHRRDDVFSLSCIAYQLLGGAHPFRGQTAARARELQQSPAPLRDLPPRQWRCLQHGLAWQREQRPASAREWWTAFKGGDTPVLAGRTTAPAHSTVVYAAHEETTPRARITAGSRIGAPLAADSQSVSRQRSSAWPVAITLSLLAVLAFAFLSVDLDSAAVPKLVKAQTSMRQVINRTIDRNLEALRGVGGGTTTRPPSGSSAAQTPDNAATNPSGSPADADEAPIANATALDDTSGAPDRAAGEQNVVSDAHSATDRAQLAESAARSESAKPPAADQVSTARGRITFAQDTYVANKQDGAAHIRIKREGGAAGKATFMWWTEPGTAEIGRDYMPLGRKTETLGNGEREITVFVPLVVGADNHNRHVFFVELGNPSDGLRSGRITRARVIIMDD